MKSCSFTGDKYMTRGIKEELPAVLVGYMWGLIEERKKNVNVPMDYLQVFKLESQIEDNNEILMIKHSQEKPFYEDIHQLNYFTRVEGKIFVIDDGNHVTMMFAEEY